MLIYDLFGMLHTWEIVGVACIGVQALVLAYMLIGGIYRGSFLDD